MWKEGEEVTCPELKHNGNECKAARKLIKDVMGVDIPHVFCPCIPNYGNCPHNRNIMEGPSKDIPKAYCPICKTDLIMIDGGKNGCYCPTLNCDWAIMPNSKKKLSDEKLKNLKPIVIHNKTPLNQGDILYNSKMIPVGYVDTIKHRKVRYEAKCICGNGVRCIGDRWVCLSKLPSKINCTTCVWPDKNFLCQKYKNPEVSCINRDYVYWEPKDGIP